MKLLIFATHKDVSLFRIEDEARNEHIEYQTIYFETLFIVGNDLWVQLDDKKRSHLAITPRDLLLIRWPFDADDTQIEYNIFVHFLLIHYEMQVVFDRKCLQRFTPYYEDKLFQSFVFKHLTIPSPRVDYFKNSNQVRQSETSFPLVFKKRVSSRSKNNFLVTSFSDLEKKLDDRVLTDYLFQEVVDIEYDVRVLAFKGTILGAVNRFTHLREGNRLAVKGREVFSNIPDEVKEEIKRSMAFLGADFVGFDVLFTKDTKHFFIEANLSPQFDKFEEATGVNVAQVLIKEVHQAFEKA